MRLASRRLPERLPNGEDARVQFVDGYYVFPVADYPVFSFAQVLRLVDVGHGDFVADVGTFTVFGGDADQVAGTSAEHLRQDCRSDVYGGPERRSRIRRVRERFILLEYLDVP